MSNRILKLFLFENNAVNPQSPSFKGLDKCFAYNEDNNFYNIFFK